MEENTTIGHLLKSAREKQKLSLDDIINKTKININVLRALEEDQISELPNKTYVKGFVTNYAKAVGVDVELARNSLDYTYQSLFPEQGLSSDSIENSNESSQDVSSTPTTTQVNKEAEELKETLISILQSLFSKKVIFSIIAIVITVSIFRGISSFFSQLTSESKSIVNQENPLNLKPKESDLFDSKATKKLAKEISETPKPEPSPAPIVAAVEPKLEPEPELKPEPEDKPIEKPKEPTARLNGKFPFKSFYPAPTNMYDIVESSAEANDPSLLPPNIKASTVKEMQNVYIVATEDNTWISYQVDDEKIKRYVLKKGRRVLLKGKRILLFMGNFNATKVFLNNKLVKAETRTGVKSMIFPEEDARNFELPLFPSYQGIPYSANEYKENMAEKSIN